jgi:hypothetical protein
VVGVHGMPQLVGQRAQAEQVVLVGHHDERMGAVQC